MSYNGQKGSSYGSQQKRGWRGSSRNKKKEQIPEGFSRRDMRSAQVAFEGRSAISRGSDLAKEAPIAENLEVWLHSPSSFDIPSIDSKLGSMQPGERQKQVKAIASVVFKRSVEIHVKTPKDSKQAQKTKRFKVVPKAKKKEEVEKAVKEIEKKTEAEIKELKKVDAEQAKAKESRLPSQQEIYEEAVRLWRQENGYLENTANPTRIELQEEGLLNQAKLNLMTSEDTQATRQTMDYVDGIRQELEKIGFAVIPIEGF